MPYNSDNHINRQLDISGGRWLYQSTIYQMVIEQMK